MASRLIKFPRLGRGRKDKEQSGQQLVQSRRERHRVWSSSVRTIALICLGGLLAIRIWDPFPVESLRLKTFDTFQRIEPRVATAAPVVVVDIDEASLASYGQWPWPRTVIARLIEQIFRSGAVVLGFDVIFAEPDRTSPGAIAKNLKGLPDDMVAQLKKLPSNDTVMANMIRRTRVVLGQAADPKSTKILRAGKKIKTPVAEVGGDPRSSAWATTSCGGGSSIWRSSSWARLRRPSGPAYSYYGVSRATYQSRRYSRASCRFALRMS
jgi:hypothetical protein